MHIGFRRSGGRGEYEVVGSQAGYTALSLEGWTFNLSWPDGIVRETGLGLEPADSGKPRLRSLRTTPYQVGRMVAAMLLMPDPRRSFVSVPTQPVVLHSKGYVLTRVGFGPDTEFNNVVDIVDVDPIFVEAENGEGSQVVGVTARWNRIRRIYEARESLPSSIAIEIAAHQSYMASGKPVTAELTKIVSRLARALGRYIPGHDPSADSLLALDRLLGFATDDGPDLPVPSEVGESESDVKARSAFQWRLAKSRGADGARFRRLIRGAYKDRCVFCGGAFVAKGIPSGLDAAHILAWSSYNLDVVTNGLSLCRLHHWAFDGSLVVPYHEAGQYYMRFTRLALALDARTRSLIGQDGAVIRDEWLPDDISERPSIKFLNRLYADLSIELVS